MTGGPTLLPDSNAQPAPARSRRFRSALGLTILGAVLPGTALIAAGRRRTGAAILLVFALLVAGAVWLVTSGQQTAIRTALNAHKLLWVVGGTAVLALLWIVVIVVGYRLLVPAGTSRGRHLLGGFVVLLLVAAVAAPAVEVGRLALVQRDLIAGVFHDGQSATVVDKPNPFGGKERVNVLLLGGDGGVGREGVRTDTVIVASIDTHTGNTTLISLPRNLENLPFPPGSALAKAYPNGFQSTSEDEGLLNAVYRNGPAAHPNILGPTDNPGADFLKLGVGEATGLHIDYYVLVNLSGFSKLVDTLGGITVNVNYYVPVGGEPTLGQLPDDYISPGPNKHMDGATALAWARGRFGLTDYLRMARQRCAIQAIVKAADPVTLLAQYQQLAATTKDTVSTDIPSSALDDFVSLGFKVKDASIRSLVFDTSLINPAYPNYDKMRSLIATALNPTSASSSSASSSSASSSSPAPSTSSSPSASATPSGAPPTTNPVANVKDACAYDPTQANAALAKGEPPTKTHP
jgi:LCP family protein required for cell wall assembly